MTYKNKPIEEDRIKYLVNKLQNAKEILMSDKPDDLDKIFDESIKANNIFDELKNEITREDLEKMTYEQYILFDDFKMGFSNINLKFTPEFIEANI